MYQPPGRGVPYYPAAPSPEYYSGAPMQINIIPGYSQEIPALITQPVAPPPQAFIAQPISPLQMGHGVPQLIPYNAQQMKCPPRMPYRSNNPEPITPKPKRNPVQNQPHFNEEAHFKEQIIRKFAKLLLKRGPMEATHADILNMFINLSPSERKVVMTQGGIKSFLTKSDYVEAQGHLLVLSKIPADVDIHDIADSSDTSLTTPPGEKYLQDDYFGRMNNGTGSEECVKWSDNDSNCRPSTPTNERIELRLPDPEEMFGARALNAGIALSRGGSSGTDSRGSSTDPVSDAKDSDLFTRKAAECGIRLEEAPRKSLSHMEEMDEEINYVDGRMNDIDDSDEDDYLTRSPQPDGNVLTYLDLSSTQSITKDQFYSWASRMSRGEVYESSDDDSEHGLPSSDVLSNHINTFKASTVPGKKSESDSTSVENKNMKNISETEKDFVDVHEEKTAPETTKELSADREIMENSKGQSVNDQISGIQNEPAVPCCVMKELEVQPQQDKVENMVCAENNNVIKEVGVKNDKVTQAEGIIAGNSTNNTEDNTDDVDLVNEMIECGKCGSDQLEIVETDETVKQTQNSAAGTCEKEGERYTNELDKMKLESISSMKYESDLERLAKKLTEDAVAEALHDIDCEEKARIAIDQINNRLSQSYYGTPPRLIRDISSSQLSPKAEQFFPRRISVESNSSSHSSSSADLVTQRRSASPLAASAQEFIPKTRYPAETVDVKEFVPQSWSKIVCDNVKRASPVDSRMFDRVNIPKPTRTTAVDPLKKAGMNEKAAEFIPRLYRCKEMDTQTEVQMTDVAVNTRRIKQADFSVQHIGYGLCEVCVNTEESVFDDMKVVTKEMATNTRRTVTTDTGIQTPNVFKKAMRNRATMTESTQEGTETNFMSELLMQRAINRAAKAEEKLLNLKAQIAITQLMKTMEEVKYLAYLKQSGVCEIAVSDIDLKEAASEIETELMRVQVLYETGMSAVRLGKPTPDVSVMEETMLVCEDMGNLFIQSKDLPTVLEISMPQLTGSSTTSILQSLLPRMPVIKPKSSPESQPARQLTQLGSTSRPLAAEVSKSVPASSHSVPPPSAVDLKPPPGLQDMHDANPSMANFPQYLQSGLTKDLQNMYPNVQYLPHDLAANAAMVGNPMASYSTVQNQGAVVRDLVTGQAKYINPNSPMYRPANAPNSTNQTTPSANQSSVRTSMANQLPVSSSNAAVNIAISRNTQTTRANQAQQSHSHIAQDSTNVKMQDIVRTSKLNPNVPNWNSAIPKDFSFGSAQKGDSAKLVSAPPMFGNDTMSVDRGSDSGRTTISEPKEMSLRESQRSLSCSSDGSSFATRRSSVQSDDGSGKIDWWKPPATRPKTSGTPQSAGSWEGENWEGDMNEESNNWMITNADAYKIPKRNPMEMVGPVQGKYIPGLTPVPSNKPDKKSDQSRQNQGSRSSSASSTDRSSYQGSERAVATNQGLGGRGRFMQPTNEKAERVGISRKAIGTGHLPAVPLGVTSEFPALAKKAVNDNPWNLPGGAKPKTNVWNQPPAAQTIPAPTSHPHSSISVSSSKMAEADSTNPLVGAAPSQSNKTLLDNSRAADISSISLADALIGEMDDDEDWQQVSVTKKKKGGKSEKPKMKLPPRSGNRGDIPSTTIRSSNFDNLVAKLLETFPDYSRNDVIQMVQEVRTNHGGLKGLSMFQIISEAKVLVQDWKRQGKGPKPEPLPEYITDLSKNFIYKTAICTYWQAGTCASGDQCQYAHGRDELKPQPKHLLCSRVSKGLSCPHGDKCIFAHSKAELKEGKKNMTVLSKNKYFNTEKKQPVLKEPQFTTANPWSKLEECENTWQSQEGDLKECVICLASIRPSQERVLECGHRFHEPCIMRWLLGEERTCPTCRTHALLEDDFPKLGST